MHYFVTGHTGFKGAWLIALLRSQGHSVSGYALPPVEGSLFERAKLSKDLEHNWFNDIRDFDKLSKAIAESQPDRIVHLAAQPLVLRSWEDPDETFTTNVGGTLNLLSATKSSGIKQKPQVLIVTTDKVYRDQGLTAYDEKQPLGGADPYSSSKALADLLSQSWIQSFPDDMVLVARAGNVIGEFDVSRDRLIPDSVRALSSGKPLIIRNPSHVRPWQHVLDCVSGYLRYMDTAASNPSITRVMNFGPSREDQQTVLEIIDKIRLIRPDLRVEFSVPTGAQETSTLLLDATRSFEELGWCNKIDLQTALQRIVDAPLSNVRDYLYRSTRAYMKS